MKILQELQTLIPPLSNEEFKQLERNILEEGIRDPLITWNGILIDGHNRYRIAQEHDINYETLEKEFENIFLVKVWMIYNQFGRRNLSNYQRSVLALQLEDVFKEKAKENLILSGENFGKGSPILANPIEIKSIDTRKEISKVANVSHGTLDKVKVIQSNATPEVKARLNTGAMSINEAYKEIKKEEKIQERKELIEKQIKDIEDGHLPELSGIYDVISIDPPWPYGREYDPESSRVANPYPEMSIEQIADIQLPASDNSILFLWTTHKFLPDSFELMKSWGFEYKATMVWNKQKIGMGSWFRMQCEFCIFGVKGRPFWQNTRYNEIINESRREHSRKPDGFFDLVNEICTGRKLEYFSREARPGWDIFGNDTNKFI
jgi:N6-adenosine-specific RNA methylase IME4